MVKEQGDKISGAEKSESGNRAGRCEEGVGRNDVAAMNSARERLTAASHKAGRSHVQGGFSGWRKAMAERPVQARRERPQVAEMAEPSKTAASLTQSMSM